MEKILVPNPLPTHPPHPCCSKSTLPVGRTNWKQMFCGRCFSDVLQVIFRRTTTDDDDGRRRRTTDDGRRTTDGRRDGRTEDGRRRRDGRRDGRTEDDDDDGTRRRRRRRKNVKNTFKVCSHIQKNTQNPNPIFKITICFTK